MMKKVISFRPRSRRPRARQPALSPAARSRDTLGRPLRDLRISVTDRCNFRCVYCMPKEVFGADYEFLPHERDPEFEEIARLARIFVGLGVREDPPDRRRAAGAPQPRAA